MKTMKLHPALLLACLVLASQPLDAADAAVEKVEVVVYGGTPGGVMAAVEAARHGHRVALINVSNHVGGVISGGLTNTDIGSRDQARSGGTRYIFASPGLASCRWLPLSSNVRQRGASRAALEQSQRLAA